MTVESSAQRFPKVAYGSLVLRVKWSTPSAEGVSLLAQALKSTQHRSTWSANMAPIRTADNLKLISQQLRNIRPATSVYPNTDPLAIERRPMKLRHLSALAFSLITAAAQAEPVAKMEGGVLVNASGMTLYTFDKDVAGSGKSACNGPCIALWPAVAAGVDAMAGDAFSVITRDDGSQQWAYQGKPLYTYATDKKAGDRLGDNFKDMWHVVK